MATLYPRPNSDDYHRWRGRLNAILAERGGSDYRPFVLGVMFECFCASAWLDEQLEARGVPPPGRKRSLRAAGRAMGAMVRTLDRDPWPIVFARLRKFEHDRSARLDREALTLPIDRAYHLGFQPGQIQ